MVSAGANPSSVQHKTKQHGVQRTIWRIMLQFVADMRVTFTWIHLTVPVLLGLILWGILDRPAQFRSVNEALVNLELLLPMLAGLLISDTLSRDWADRTIEWRLTQPGGPIRLLTLRAITTAAVWSVIVGVFLVATHAVYLRPADLVMPWRTVMILLGPPALFFTGLAVLVSLLGRGSLSGLLATAGYWALSFMSAGLFTGPFHVHYLRLPLEHVSYEANRWWLVAGGTLLLALGGVVFAKAERWIR